MLKKLLPSSVLLFASLFVKAQYYYKDITGTKETAELIKSYKLNKVAKVVINSYDAENTKNEDFYVEQVYDPLTQVLRTVTRSGVSDASVLISFTDAKGNVVKTIDSSETSISTTTYNYNPEGLLITVHSTSSDTSSKTVQIEDHIWQYEQNKVKRMLRIKDKQDTTIVNFKFDEAGNVSEEVSMRKGVQSEPVYYYYDSNNRLTDIVRFNKKAKRLLPEYMFEYSPSNQVIQKITVPANSSDYLIWRYQYNSNGLKTKEAVYNKQKQLTGKIEYEYVFRN
jgi:YD repeat-containing protein